MRKQLAAVGLTAGLAVGGVAGFAFTSGTAAVGAQDETTTTAPVSAPTKADRPDRSGRIQETLRPLVEDGTITQAQADKVTDALVAASPDRDHGDRGGPWGHGGFGLGLDVAAKALGITADELRTELQKGSSIADVAKAKGVDPATVTDALVAEATTRIDEQVANGKVTRDEADQRIAELKDRIAAMVNGELPAGGPGAAGGPGRGHGEFGGRGGWGHGPTGGDERPNEAPTTTEG